MHGKVDMFGNNTIGNATTCGEVCQPVKYSLVYILSNGGIKRGIRPTV
jgi:hypothetical protein